jgi:sensor histidine kinase YesM
LHVSPLSQIIIAIANLVLWIPLDKLITFIISKTSYGWYIGSAYDSGKFYLIGFVFIILSLAVMYFFYYVGNDSEDKDYNMMLNLTWGSLVLMLYSSTLPQINRINIYLVSIVLLDAPVMFLREKKPSRRLLYILLVIAFYSSKLLFDIYKNKWYGAVPYQTFWGVG